MKNFLLLIALSVPCVAMAQHNTFGGTIGSGIWWTHADEHQPSHSISLNESIFIHRDTKGRFSFELALSHDGYQYSIQYIQYSDTPPDEYLIQDHLRAHIFSLSLKTDIRLSSGHTRLQQFAGISLTPAIYAEWHSGTVEYPSPLQPFHYHQPPDNYAMLLMGVEYRIQYAVTARLAARAVAAFQIVPPAAMFSTFTDHAACVNTSLNLGLTYRIR